MTPKPRQIATPARAVGYIRVSTDRQELGPRAQVAALRAWAESRGVKIVRWRFDKGVSGTTELQLRPQLLAALEDVARLKATVFLVHKRDRLARDVYIAHAVEVAIRKLGAEVVATDCETTGDESGDLIRKTIDDLMAHLEVIRIRARTRAALAVKKARGERTGSVPYGWSEAEGGKLVPCEAEQANIAALRALRASGASLRRIATLAAGQGVLNRSGQPFQFSQIRVLLRRAEPSPPR